MKHRTAKKVSADYLSPQDILLKFKTEILETTRRRIAIKRYFYGALVRFRRCASVGPNANFYSVFLKVPGQNPVIQTIDAASLQDLVDAVTDDEVYVELDNQFARSLNGDTDA